MKNVFCVFPKKAIKSSIKQCVMAGLVLFDLLAGMMSQARISSNLVQKVSLSCNRGVTLSPDRTLRLDSSEKTNALVCKTYLNLAKTAK